MKKIINFVIMLILITSCQPPEVGYVSDNVHALEDTLYASRGAFTVSALPATHGSTQPMNWEFTSIRDDQGAETLELFEEHEIRVWKEAYNPTTDTTLALVEAKLEMSSKPSILLNNRSGQIAITQASAYLKGGEYYDVGVKVDNIRGEKYLDDYLTVKFEPFVPAHITGEMRSRINCIKIDGGKKALSTSVVTPNDSRVDAVMAGTDPYFSVVKVDEEPKLGIKVKMIIADSHDNPFPPDDVLFYPYNGGTLQCFHDNSIVTTDEADGTVFELPAPPFPQYSKNGWGDLMYYVTNHSAFTVDKEAYERDNGAHDWSQYKQVDGNVVCEGYERWAIRIDDTGTWEIKMRIPYSKKL